MSAGWSAQELQQPITAERPCGDNLEDTPLLASFDAFRVFGESRPLDAAPEEGENRPPKPLDAPVWREIRDQAVETLAKSRDLRVLAYLAAATLRTDGLRVFSETLRVAAGWLQSYWKEVYPPVEEDAILRRNALNCFADPMAVGDALRRVPLAISRQHGRFSLRDLDIATGQIPAAEGDGRVSEAQVNAAFAAMPYDDLNALHESVAGALTTVQAIDTTMRLEGGPEAAPNLEPLTAQLTRVARVLRGQLARRDAEAPAGEAEPTDAAAPQGQPTRAGVGAVRSREDAIRALEAVADFFRRSEPSSPVPLIVDRAKRLVAKDFMEVLADIAPDAVAQARLAGGMRNAAE